MRALPILAALICATPLAKASTNELELLQSRCQEQERQIRQLEEENSRLKSLVTTAAKTPAPVQATTPAAAPAKTESKKEEESPKATTSKAKTSDAASYGIVRDGDTLNKLAQRNRTSPEALAELNNLKKPYLIRAGQRLRLPEKPEASAKATESTKPATASTEKPKSAPQGGTHTVKKGENFYSIARRYGMSENALQAANPSAKPTGLRIGQTLQLGGKPAAETKTTKAASSSNKSSATPAKTKSGEVDAVAKSKGPSEASPKHEVAKTTETSKPATETKAAAAPEASAPAPSSAEAEQPAANGSRIRTVAIEETTPLTSFAAAHGTSIARLNALNGLNLNSSTVLAKGSELYVPAQP